MNTKNAVIGAISTLALAASIAPAALAQIEEAPAEAPSKTAIEHRQRPNFENLTFEEVQTHVLEKLDNMIEHISERMEKIAENTELTEELKKLMTEGAQDHLANATEERTAVASATSKEELKELREANQEEKEANRDEMKARRDEIRQLMEEAGIERPERSEHPRMEKKLGRGKKGMGMRKGVRPFGQDAEEISNNQQ